MEFNLEYIREIGSGAYGVVYEAWNRTKVAVKKTNIPAKQKGSLQNEIEALKKCKHTNIVSFFGTTVESGELIIVMEYGECGSLDDFLHGENCEKRNASAVARLNWMLQLANGMAYLHDQNIAHRDLKPDNLVLTDKYKTLKICDFGLVKQLATNNTELKGTVKYMAPEVGYGRYTTKCDVFSFGIVLWEVMSNKKPFYELEGMVVLAQVTKINEGARPKLDEVKTYVNFNHIKRLMELCWDKNPDNRPTMKRVAFILSIDHSSVDHNQIEKIEPLPLTRDVDFTGV